MLTYTESRQQQFNILIAQLCYKHVENPIRTILVKQAFRNLQQCTHEYYQ